MKRIIFILMAFVIVTSCLFAQMSFDDFKGVWSPIETLNIIINEDYRPLNFSVDGNVYVGWGSSIIVEKKNFPNYRFRMNGGYDEIISSYFRNNMLILIVENNGEGTKGEIGITFVEKDKIFFTLISGRVTSPLYFGNDNIYIRAPRSVN